MTFGIKWPQFGLFAKFYLNHHWMSHLVKVLAVYLDTVDVLLYAIIAANRYSVMAAASGHQAVKDGGYSLRRLIFRSGEGDTLW